MKRQQNLRWDRQRSRGLPGKFAQCFNFQVAPLAAGLARLAQPVEFRLCAASQLAAAKNPAAGRHQCQTLLFESAQRFQKGGPLAVGAQPIQPQLDGRGKAGRNTQLANGFASRGGSNNGTKTIWEGLSMFRKCRHMIENKSYSMG